ncbi:phage repressor protein [Rhizobium sp. VS19-DR104.2]|uniref:S24 family peptidase n=1 Tax=unclassified Rhizobium TaxID=2613769 RepID=UPI001CC3F427|nr:MULTISPECIES: S24 family peptidase [unclassified Rhizobium]MBZ5761545.1 phage repressor protein [Rhizobium sp. VS19-DR96]MBZ5767493.1 phage repressor protein [Rhizobium sp. VS19-DR129.2]MBZ5775058.1 phage repressor protein [Rhizobium sp. VS19-DRK62.2]MBZ5785977.1 phage repressor protein [Rhizobium sp. VS19-DR121]MBZ5803403.1 phage repressor protein [Rhizobium sp. VS19-DR181]
MRMKSQERFAEAVSGKGKTVSRGAVGNWELGKEVGLDSLTAICELSGVDLNWLAYNKGEGPKVQTVGRTGIQSSLISSFDPDDAETEQSDASTSYSREHWRPAVDGAIPEIDVKLGAGSGVVGDVINLSVGSQTFSAHPVVAEWLIPEDYLRKEAKVSPAQTLIMEIIGDSMTPTYQPGDRVMIDLGQNQMSTDTVYAISDGRTEPQIKRLQRVPFSEPAQVIIISDNQNLERFTVELERLSIIGRVCGHIARR